jgi:hypothetical protein
LIREGDGNTIDEGEVEDFHISHPLGYIMYPLYWNRGTWKQGNSRRFRVNGTVFGCRPSPYCGWIIERDGSSIDELELLLCYVLLLNFSPA